MERTILKENAVHGTNAYPYAVYEWEKNVRGQVDLHWHKETEIIFLKQGVIRLNVSMKEYQVKAPALVFVGGGEIHSLLLEEGSKESAIVFDLQMLSFENYDGVQHKVIAPLLKKQICFPLFLYPSNECWEEIGRLYSHIEQDAHAKTLGSYLKMKAALYQLIACLYDHNGLLDIQEMNDGDTARIDVMKRVLTYIGDNYSKKMTVEDIAFQAGMNPQYFCRYFKKATGKTIINYVNDIRIRQAARELEHSDEKIIDIGGRCGYDNMGYFIKRFRQKHGMSPSEFRRAKKSK